MKFIIRYLTKQVSHQFSNYCPTGDYVWTEKVSRLEHWRLRVVEFSWEIVLAIAFAAAIYGWASALH